MPSLADCFRPRFRSLLYGPSSLSEPERRALGALYQELSVTLNAPLRVSPSAPSRQRAEHAGSNFACSSRTPLD